MNVVISSWRGLRASKRLIHCAVHVLCGLMIVWLQWPGLGVDARRARVQQWARKMLRLTGVALHVDGEVIKPCSLWVINHVSWLDILAVHAVAPHARFVSKADVKAWPLLSHLVDSAGTLYLERERKRDALRVVHVMAQALKAGETVAIFPEGTTGDGHALLPFHANLLQAAISTGAPVQAVALRYSDAIDAVSTAVAFVGKTTLLQSLWRVACAQDLQVHITLLAPRETCEFTERRALAALLRNDIAERLNSFKLDNAAERGRWRRLPEPD